MQRPYCSISNSLNLKCLLKSTLNGGKQMLRVSLSLHHLCFYTASLMGRRWQRKTAADLFSLSFLFKSIIPHLHLIVCTYVSTQIWSSKAGIYCSWILSSLPTTGSIGSCYYQEKSRFRCYYGIISVWWN